MEGQRRNVSICTTTIHVPHCLEEFAKNAQEHGHAPTFVVSGDLKTPFGCGEFCAELASRFPSMRFVYLGPAEQVLLSSISPLSSRVSR